jgi:type IV secretion system protein VirB9
MRLQHFALCVAIALPLPALAVQPTYASPGDPRVRFVDYDPNNVVTIYGRVGDDTLVMFDKGEKILDLGGGDTDAWGVGVITAGNGFFIKPTATSPNTNVHVVTDKRVYSIDMKLAARGQSNFLTVWYKYPDLEAARRAAQANRQRAADLLKYGAAGAARNHNYTEQGSDSIAPLEASDDGTFTYFRFAAHADIPAIYTVGEDGKEHLVSKNVQDDVIQVHAVARKFVLRADNLVTCVFNESYDPIGKRPLTNTASPQVERVLKTPGESQ